ncbi:hypothetical protein V5O48_015979 [Marasmius crinis-equi]|uniref:Uncharacterized protein n=1 Tax=Marasmius crinis-equi TaxID=585013 RepID=A0ABR3ET16_9AGAR
MANPDDLTLISIIGSNLFLNGIGLLTTAIPYGIYLVLFFFAIVILCRNEGNVRARFILLLAVLLMFAISTFFVFAYAQIFLEEIRIVLISDVAEPIANKIIAYQSRFAKLSLLQEVMFFVEASDLSIMQVEFICNGALPVAIGRNRGLRRGVEGLGAVGGKSEDPTPLGSITSGINGVDVLFPRLFHSL